MKIKYFFFFCFCIREHTSFIHIASEHSSLNMMIMMMMMIMMIIWKIHINGLYVCALIHCMECRNGLCTITTIYMANTPKHDVFRCDAYQIIRIIIIIIYFILHHQIFFLALIYEYIEYVYNNK